jgi:serine protease Do
VDKVKPAVISVRVKVDGAKMMNFDGNSPFPPSSRMERFFRRFGMPFGNEGSDNQRQPHNRPVVGEGSGFFITADGYAVTNNQVVDRVSSISCPHRQGSPRPLLPDQRIAFLELLPLAGDNFVPFVASKRPVSGKLNARNRLASRAERMHEEITK